LTIKQRKLDTQRDAFTGYYMVPAHYFERSLFRRSSIRISVLGCGIRGRV